MGGEKWRTQRVMPEISNTPKGIWGKIQGEKKLKEKKTNSDTCQVLTGSKGQSSY